MISRNDNHAGFIDIHSHFLYGIDDGAASKEIMENMLDAAWTDGVREMIATPHIMPGLQQMRLDLIQERMNEARHYCLQKKYNILLNSGAEILFSPMMELFIQEHPLPTLSESSYILLEFLPNVSYETIASAIEMLSRSGYQVILAHVERYGALFHRNNAYRLKDRYGIAYQLNCSTVIDGVGLWRNRKVRRWLQEGMIDRIASDCHDDRIRQIRMNEAYEKMCCCYGNVLADKMMKNRVLP